MLPKEDTTAHESSPHACRGRRIRKRRASQTKQIIHTTPTQTKSHPKSTPIADFPSAPPLSYPQSPFIHQEVSKYLPMIPFTLIQLPSTNHQQSQSSTWASHVQHGEPHLPITPSSQKITHQSKFSKLIHANRRQSSSMSSYRGGACNPDLTISNPQKCALPATPERSTGGKGGMPQ